MLSSLRMLTGRQRRAFFASLAGWSLDAFDFFIFVFCLRSISAEFHTDVKSVAEGIFLMARRICIRPFCKRSTASPRRRPATSPSS